MYDHWGQPTKVFCCPISSGQSYGIQRYSYHRTQDLTGFTGSHIGLNLETKESDRYSHKRPIKCLRTGLCPVTATFGGSYLKFLAWSSWKQPNAEGAISLIWHTMRCRGLSFKELSVNPPLYPTRWKEKCIRLHKRHGDKSIGQDNVPFHLHCPQKLRPFK